MVSITLQRMSRRLYHWFLEHFEAVAVMGWKDSSNLSHLFHGSVSRWLAVLISHPSTTFFMIHHASPFPNFLRDKGYCCDTSPASFGQKTESILQKTCYVICWWTSGPPWKITNKSSRYTMIFQLGVSIFVRNEAVRLMTVYKEGDNCTWSYFQYDIFMGNPFNSDLFYRPSERKEKNTPLWWK